MFWDKQNSTIKYLTKVDQVKVKAVQGLSMILFQQMAHLHNIFAKMKFPVAQLLQKCQRATWRSPTESDPSWASATGCSWNSGGPCAIAKIEVTWMLKCFYREKRENRWEEMEHRVWCVVLWQSKKRPLLVLWSRRLGRNGVQTHPWQLLGVSAGTGQWWDICRLSHIVARRGGYEHFNVGRSENVQKKLSCQKSMQLEMIHESLFERLSTFIHTSDICSR